MIEFLLLLITMQLMILTTTLSHYNERQAKALREVAETATEWVDAQSILKRNEEVLVLVVDDPCTWIETNSGYSKIKVLRLFDSIPAIEFSCATGTLVATPLRPSKLFNRLNPPTLDFPIPKAFRKSQVPLVSFNWLGRPKAKVHSISVQENVWFDKEVHQVFEELGIRLFQSVNRLWFYHIETERK